MFEISQYTEVSLIGVALLVTILIADHKNHVLQLFLEYEPVNIALEMSR